MISQHAWNVVTGTELFEDRGKPKSLTPVIYDALRSFLANATHQPLGYRGKPLTDQFEWVSSKGFAGRSMKDMAQELEGAALESAAVAVDSHDPTKSPLVPWVLLVMRRDLFDAFEAWLRTMSSTNDRRESHENVDDPKIANPPLAQKRVEGKSQLDYRMTAPREAPPPADDVDREMVETALGALNWMEEEALRRFAEGESYHKIARHLDLSSHTSARRIVQRARARAQEALS